MRVGQVGRSGRVWFERGVRPRGTKDMRHDSAWIFGAVCPERDTGVALVMPYPTSEAMQQLLDELSGELPQDRHAVLIVDGAGWHTAHRLRWPANVTPLRLPAYSPELNLIERVWLYLRERYLSHQLFDTYEAILDGCCAAWNALLAETGRIASLGGAA